jgi:2,3-bisphosphoglycerate-dependent phosphoglycerate mutase
MTQLYLIRHGQSISAVERTIANKGLSPLGVEQAELLRDRLAAKKDIAADVIISSTMLRARETAEIIAPALGLPIVFESDVEEWRDGEAEDMFNLVEYEKKFNEVPFDQKPFFHIVPDAESWSQFMLRAATTLNRITNEYEGKNIVIVCHGGIIESSFLLFFGMTTFHLPRAFLNTHNTSITHWRKFSWAKLPISWVLESYNDIMHLKK